MKYNFINDLSLFRTAQLQKFLLINIYSHSAQIILIKRKEVFYKIKNDDLKDYSILAEENIYYSGNLKQIKNKLNEFVQKNNLKDITAIIGINEFKFSTITIPSDTDDIDLWFLENTSKFLPEGRTADDFKFSYEPACPVDRLIKEDDNYKHFNLVVTRNDYLNEVINSCSIEGLRIYALFPFHLALNSLKREEGKNSLFIDLFSDKVLFSFYAESRNFLGGEIYNHFEEENLTRERTIKESLIQLKQNLLLNFNGKSFENLELFICSKKDEYEIIKKYALNVFDNSTLNKSFPPEHTPHLPSLFALNKILKDDDLKINLLPESLYIKERDFTEKELTLKLILASGAVIIILLMFAMTAEGILSGLQENEEENIEEINAEFLQLNSLQKENKFLKANFSLLQNLKSHGSKYSNLLNNISNVVSSNCCLTGLNIKEEDKYINIDLTGLAVSQQDIAELMKSMESDKNFKDITLLYTSMVKDNPDLKKKNLVQFNLSAKYYAN